MTLGKKGILELNNFLLIEQGTADQQWLNNLLALNEFLATLAKQLKKKHLKIFFGFAHSHILEQSTHLRSGNIHLPAHDVLATNARIEAHRDNLSPDINVILIENFLFANFSPQRQNTQKETNYLNLLTGANVNR